MELAILLLEFCLLGLIAAVYFAAKKDLSASAARAQSPTQEEVEQLQSTIAGLIAALETKAAEVEDRLQARFDSLVELENSRAPGAVQAVDTPVSIVQSPAPAPLLVEAAKKDAVAGFVPTGIVAAAVTSRVKSAACAVPGRPDDSDRKHLLLTEGSPSPLEKALQLIEQGSDRVGAARATGLSVAEIETAQRIHQMRAKAAQE